jgi:hypothetical protein
MGDLGATTHANPAARCVGGLPLWCRHAKPSGVCFGRVRRKNTDRGWAGCIGLIGVQLRGACRLRRGGDGCNLSVHVVRATPDKEGWRDLFVFAAITETVGYENESQANGSAEPAGDCYVRPWREITIQRNDVAGSGASLERKWQFGRLPWLC